MEIKDYKIYEHLRDFGVPTTILDNIFSSPDDKKILIKAWNALTHDGNTPDECAKQISDIVFKELDINPDQSFDEEK